MVLVWYSSNNLDTPNFTLDFGLASNQEVKLSVLDIEQVIGISLVFSNYVDSSIHKNRLMSIGVLTPHVSRTI